VILQKELTRGYSTIRVQCQRRFQTGSPAILVQVGDDLEGFPGKPRTPSQLVAMGLRGCVETPPTLGTEHPEARVFAVRHHPHRQERPVGRPVPPVWSSLAAEA